MENEDSKNKKAQISVFIILAVIVVVVIGLYFIVKGGDINLKNINPQIKPIYSFVESCLKQTTEDAVYYIGDTGGYFIAPNLSTRNNVAYYFYENKNYMPSKEQIEQELASYVSEMMFFCVKNFVKFPDFEVKQEEIQTKAKIKDKEVLFEVNYPLSITKGEKTYDLKAFNNKVPVRLGVIYEAVYNIIKEQEETPKDICLTCIEEQIMENDLFISLWDYEEDTIFSVIDAESKIKEGAFEFYFANKYEV